MPADPPAVSPQPSVQAQAPQARRPLPRDGEIAIREEFANAVVAGEVAALQLFIRRHPDHALADIARIILERGLYGPPPAQD